MSHITKTYTQNVSIDQETSLSTRTHTQAPLCDCRLNFLSSLVAANDQKPWPSPCWNASPPEVFPRTQDPLRGNIAPAAWPPQVYPRPPDVCRCEHHTGPTAPAASMPAAPLHPRALPIHPVTHPIHPGSDAWRCGTVDDDAGVSHGADVNVRIEIPVGCGCHRTSCSFDH